MELLFCAKCESKYDCTIFIVLLNFTNSFLKYSPSWNSEKACYVTTMRKSCLLWLLCCFVTNKCKCTWHFVLIFVNIETELWNWCRGMTGFLLNNQRFSVCYFHAYMGQTVAPLVSSYLNSGQFKANEFWANAFLTFSWMLRVCL